MAATKHQVTGLNKRTQLLNMTRTSFHMQPKSKSFLHTNQIKTPLIKKSRPQRKQMPDLALVVPASKLTRLSNRDQGNNVWRMNYQGRIILATRTSARMCRERCPKVHRWSLIRQIKDPTKLHQKGKQFIRKI